MRMMEHGKVLVPVVDHIFFAGRRSVLLRRHAVRFRATTFWCCSNRTNVTSDSVHKVVLRFKKKWDLSDLKHYSKLRLY